MVRKNARGLDRESDNSITDRRRSIRSKIPNILILVGIVVMVLPFTTEVLGYFTSIQMVEAWEKQAATQKKQAQKVKEDQDRLVSMGKLPDEETIIGGTSTKTSKKEKQETEKKEPFPKTKVIIPKIGVNQVVLEGTSPEVLKYGPGHYVGMANPGDKGNVGIAGHRVTYTRPFYRLDELTGGDSIILETVDYTYEYVVQNMVVVDPKNVSTLMPTEDPRVTITTCNPKYSARTRLNVTGVLVNSKPRRANIIRTVKEIFKEEKKIELPKAEINTKKSYAELMKDLAAANKAVKKDPLDVNAYSNLSRIYLALERYPDSIKALRKAELIKPNSLEVQQTRAMVEAMKKELKQKTVIGDNGGSNNTDPMLYFNLGQILLLDGEYQESASILAEGIKIVPYVSDMHIYEAKAYEKMGYDDLALKAYNEAMVYDPSNSEVINSIERIKSKKPAGILGVNKLHYRLRPQ